MTKLIKQKDLELGMRVNRVDVDGNKFQVLTMTPNFLAMYKSKTYKEDSFEVHEDEIEEVVEEKFVYHYSAKCVTRLNRYDMDGLADLTFKVESMEDYSKLKLLIGEEFNIEDVVPITITSLSYLGRKEG